MIRPGRPGDTPGIRALRTAYAAELRAVGHAGSADPDWLGWLARRVHAGDVRVVEEATGVVGYIAWELRQSPARRVLSVRELYVAPSERGRRHGGGLLARALDRARADHAAEIEIDAGLDDEAARSLVRSFGFIRADGRRVRVIAAASDRYGRVSPQLAG